MYLSELLDRAEIREPEAMQQSYAQGGVLEEVGATC